MPVGDRGPGRSYRAEDPPPSAYGAHQPGIATPVLDHLAFAVLDLKVGSASQLAELLRGLTVEADSRMAAHRAGPGRSPAGELTITLGLGPALFERRLGLGPRRPVALRPLPRFDRDCLDPASSSGDLCLQVCAARPEIADDALAALLEGVGEAGTLLWSQRASMVRRPGEPAGSRPRNLLGFKEATGNPRRGVELDRHVWAGPGERTWMTGGTFLVVRQVRVDLPSWRSLPLAAQEEAIGRHRESGAPLGLEHEFEPLPLSEERIPADAHVRLASARSNEGATLLRRGYSYGDEDDGGLLLLFFQRDPRRQFVPVQTRLDAGPDALNQFSETVRSGVFAVPHGALPDGFLGDRLFLAS